MFDGNDGAEGEDRRVEVAAGPVRRRWSAQEKARIVEETLVPGARLSEVARRWRVCRQQIYAWRRAAGQDVKAEPEQTKLSIFDNQGADGFKGLDFGFSAAFSS